MKECDVVALATIESSEQIFLVVFDPVPFQQLTIFNVKRLPSMMLTLTFYVIDHIMDDGLVDRENRITILP